MREDEAGTSDKILYNDVCYSVENMTPIAVPDGETDLRVTDDYVIDANCCQCSGCSNFHTPTINYAFSGIVIPTVGVCVCTQGDGSHYMAKSSPNVNVSGSISLGSCSYATSFAASVQIQPYDPTCTFPTDGVAINSTVSITIYKQSATEWYVRMRNSLALFFEATATVAAGDCESPVVVSNAANFCEGGVSGSFITWGSGGTCTITPVA